MEDAESPVSQVMPVPGPETTAMLSVRHPYAPQPRWSHDDDNSVTVVQSTQDYTKHVFQAKPATARWVRGLSNEEDEPVTGGFRRRTNMRRWEDLDDTADGAAYDGSGTSQRPRRPWLYYPNLLGVFYLLLLLIRMTTGLHASYRLDFPATSRQLHLFGRRYGENAVSFGMRVGLPMSFPHIVAAAYTLVLSYRIGGAAHHFVALWGVGLSLLSAFALSTQAPMLFTLCSISSASNRWECELPFVFHHVCSVIRLLSPLLALWCVAPVLDKVRGGGWRWCCLLGVPCLLAVLAIGVGIYSEAPSEVLLDATHAAVLVTWSFLIKSCWKQPKFMLLPPMAEKLHED